MIMRSGAMWKDSEEIHGVANLAYRVGGLCIKPNFFGGASSPEPPAMLRIALGANMVAFGLK